MSEKETQFSKNQLINRLIARFMVDLLGFIADDVIDHLHELGPFDVGSIVDCFVCHVSIKKKSSVSRV
jgi:hypothetical protein